MMESNLQRSFIAAAFLPLLLLGRVEAVRADDTQSLEELRNTVINLLDGLVKKGVLTKEQAEAMVSDAQKKASEQAKAQAVQEKAEQGAVRVPFIPEIVKDQIKEQVSQELRADVTKDVVAQAQAEKWGVPGALPFWITNLNVHGDMRFRLEEDLYASDNAQGQYLNFTAVNSAGGIEKAGDNALLNLSLIHI